MKMLMFNTREFRYKTFKNSLDTENEENIEETRADSLVIFIHVEQEDAEKKERVAKKATDNIV